MNTTNKKISNNIYLKFIEEYNNFNKKIHDDLVNKKFGEKNIKIIKNINVINIINNVDKVNNYKKNELYYIIYDEDVFLFTWKNIVNKKDIDLLKFANELRKEYVDNLQKLIVKYFESNCMNNPSINFKKFCKINAMGSTALTSNYNVNVSSFLQSTDIVSKFNEYFFKFWNDTSGEIFDTNFYGNSFFITIDDKLNYNKKLDLLYNNLKSGNKNIFYLPPADNLFNINIKDVIFKQQISWLVIKIYLYLDEFKKYVNININKNINKNININKKLGLIFLKIKNILLKNISKSNNKNKNNNIDNELIIKYNNLISGRPSNGSIHENLYRKKLDELYVSKLSIIDVNQKKYMNLITNDSLNNNLKNNYLINLLESISTSNFYGNETYFCIGTIYHVLGYIQKLGKFQMYKEYYIQSMIENFIDIFRYVEYIHKDNSKFILKSSKYLFRVYDAIISYSENTEQSNITQFTIKKTLFDNIRKFYQKDSTKSLSNKLINNLRIFYEADFLNNNNSLNNNSLNTNLSIKKLEDNDIINILETVIKDITKCLQNKLND